MNAFRFVIAGVDEAGCGPLAGPVTAAAVVLPAKYENPLITDSKKLTEAKREVLFVEITKVALAYVVVSVGQRRVDSLNIRNANALALCLAMERLSKRLEQDWGHKKFTPHFLIDGRLPLRTKFSHETIIKGDSKILAISAASILAKVTRDRLMNVLESRYPGYELSRHKGYGTKAHLEAIAQIGPSTIHRRTFAGVKEHCAKTSSVSSTT